MTKLTESQLIAVNNLIKLAIDNLKIEEKKKWDDMMNRISKIQELNKSLEQENKKITDENKKLYSQMTKVSQSSNKFFFNSKEQALKAICAENVEIKSKESNIILFGVPESYKVDKDLVKNDDTDKVNKILAKIDIDTSTVKSFFRFKKSNSSDKPGLIRVEFNSKDTAIKAINSSNKLKNDIDFKTVFINSDLTKTQVFTRILSKTGIKRILN